MATKLVDLSGDTLGSIGAGIATWTDSVTSRAFTQSNVDRQPAVVAGPNSTKAARFASDALESLNSGAGVQTSLTVAMVVRVDAMPAEIRSGILAGTSATPQDDYSDPGWQMSHTANLSETGFRTMLAGGAMGSGDAVVKDSATALGQWVILTYQGGVDNTAGQAYTNGTAETVSSAGRSAAAGVGMNNLHLGARRFGSGLGAFGQFSLAALRIYSGRMSAAERSALHTEWSTKYGIAVSDGGSTTPTDPPPSGGGQSSLPSSGMVARWRAGDITGVANGASVTSWRDSVGGRTAVTGTSAPTLATGQANGKTAVRFNGSNQDLRAANPPTLNQPHTILAVVRAATTSGERQLVWQGAGGEFMILNGRWNGYAGNLLVGPLASTNVDVVTAVFSGSNGSTNIYVDGTGGTTGALGSNAMDGNLLILGGHSNISRPFSGDVYELVFYNRVLTDAERAQAHSYAQDEYGTIVSDYIAAADTQPPTTPTGLTATATSPTAVSLSWAAATDNVGVVSYRVRRDGADLPGATAVVGTTLVDATAKGNTTYSYTVSAVDAEGNRSAESAAATVKTPLPGRQVDRWSGSTLVRQIVAAWSGSALVTRIVDDGLATTLLSSLIADFSGGWGPFVNNGGLSLVGGRARHPLSTGTPAMFPADAAYTLVGTTFHVELTPGTTPAGASSAVAQVRLESSAAPSSTRVMFTVDVVTGRLTMSDEVNSADSGAVGITYDAAAHRWLRFREAGGTLFWETSPTGLPASWTTRRSKARPSWMTATPNLKPVFTTSATSGTGYVEWDNINVVPVVSGNTTTRTNLAPNPSFEVNYTDSWEAFTTSSNGATTTLDTSTSVHGGASVRFAATGTSDFGRRFTAPELEAGTYTASIWIRTQGTTNAHFLVVIGTPQDPQQHLSGTNGWARYSCTFTLASPGRPEILIGLGAYGAPSAGTAWFDGLLLEKVSTMESYFDGSTSAAGRAVSWTGSAHNSASTETVEATLGWSGETLAARQADELVDFWGVATHLTFDTYAPRRAAILQLVKEAGIRWVRDGWGAGESAAPAALVSAGLKLHATHSPSDAGNVETQAAVQAIASNHASRLGNLLLGVEGWNEPGGWDGYLNDAALTTRVRNWQQWLWTVYRNTSPYQSIPIAGPSLADTNNAAKWSATDLSAYADRANLHDYTGDSYVLTDTDFDRFIANGNLMVNKNRRITTETGITTGQIDSPFKVPSEAGAGVIIPRVQLEHFRRGWELSASYEFMNQGSAGTYEDSFGLVRNDLTPKPAYTTIKNLLTMVADPGATFTPAPLPVSIAGSNSATRSICLQSRSGAYWLILWQQVQVWNSSTGQASPSVTQPLTLSFDRSRTVSVYDPHTSATALSTTSGSTASVYSTEKITLVRIV